MTKYKVSGIVREIEFWRIVTNTNDKDEMEKPEMPNVTAVQAMSYALAAVALTGLIVIAVTGAAVGPVMMGALAAPVAAVTAMMPRADAQIREARNTSYQMEMAEATMRMASGTDEVDLDG